ncbi:putative serine esterase-domain-containing protein [Chaetomium sp. MPI-CAGE-AT-0009]|nr:putative serine esterase-domain-containing protein [Chaetomium sp. MPI-CAGE-AT-0009]
MAEYSGGNPEADHLVVLVHGLWGNPNHMASVAKALREQYTPDQVYILLAKRNSGSFTYDGIELGGERVCLEIEEELEAIKSKGGNIKKISIVGYSLGGLVARYAIGLLFARGVLDNLECMNFTAFASPFLGVRTPLRGWANQIWNVLGARTLCMSGRQLFGIDKFRDTGKPLIAVLADPNSIFMSGLAKFKRHTLYTNITNDRSAVYYTTGIAKTDPYTDLSQVTVRYLPGWDDVILDPADPVSASAPPPEEPETARASVEKWAKRVPFVAALALFIPLGVVAFLVNSAVQTVRSSRRVRLHERGLAGIPVQDFRVNLWIKEIREAVEDAYENLSSSQNQAYLVNGDGESSASASEEEEDADGEGGGASEARKMLALERKRSRTQEGGFPTLALAGYQFAAIEALDKLGWRKYPVWIHKHRHSHAAIIVRMEKEGIMRSSRAAKETSKYFDTNSTTVLPRRSTRSTLARFAYTGANGGPVPGSSSSNGDPEVTLGSDIEDAVKPAVARKRKRAETVTQSAPRRTARTTKIEVKTEVKTEIKSEVETEIKSEEPSSDDELETKPKPRGRIYDLVKEMRLTGPAANAAVDTMGCERLAQPNASARDRRFQTLVALMLSSQTKDTVNAAAMARLQNELPPHAPGAPPGLNLENMLAVDPALLNELIGKVGFHNNKTKYLKTTAALLQSTFNSDIPPTIAGLTSLPGVGPKMAHLCMSATNGWNRVEGIGVDVHVHRITNLWGWQSPPTRTPEDTRRALEAWLPRERWKEINWLLVGLGQSVCLPVGRRCGDCEVGLRGLCRSADRGKEEVKEEMELLEEEVKGEVKEDVKRDMKEDVKEAAAKVEVEAVLRAKKEEIEEKAVVEVKKEEGEAAVDEAVDETRLGSPRVKEEEL